MDKPLDIYSFPQLHPTVRVNQYAIVRAVRRLGKIEALALIREAYRTDKGLCTLLDAQLIYAGMVSDIPHRG